MFSQFLLLRLRVSKCRIGVSFREWDGLIETPAIRFVTFDNPEILVGSIRPFIQVKLRSLSRFLDCGLMLGVSNPKADPDSNIGLIIFPWGSFTSVL